jgi:hypothetical protein
MILYNNSSIHPGRDKTFFSRPSLRRTQPPVQWVKGKQVKVFRYKPEVALGVPGG